jgi:Cupin
MPVVHAPDAVVHEMHGSVFASYAAPASGSQELCAWRLEVPAGSAGAPHRVSKEEILLVLSGALQVSLTGGAGPAGPEDSDEDSDQDSVAGTAASAGTAVATAPAAAATPASAGTAAAAAIPASAAAGDVIVVPAGSLLRIGNAGPEPATAWVTTSVGLEAVLADGSRISPPWVR